MRKKKPRTVGYRHVLAGFSLLALCVLASGCVLLTGAAQREKQDARAAIAGSVATDFDSANGLVVVLLRFPEGESPRDGEIQLVDHYVLRSAGRWGFSVAPGNYAVAAFEDTNGDGAYEDEPAIVPRKADGSMREQLLMLDVKSGERRMVDLLIPRAGRSQVTERVDIALAIDSVRNYRDQEMISIGLFEVNGEVIGLDEPRFDFKNGTRGLWERMDFVVELSPGIYFLEEYDRHKMPVLFVHGISGTPREFQELIAGLDRDRFQPWVYFYPSGFNLDGIAEHLTQLMAKLEKRHDFDEFVVVAHSMGGLVSRAFLLKHETLGGAADVPLFVSMASPFGGDTAAARLETAPAAVRDRLPPAFQDMQPASAFIHGLFYRDPESRETRRGLPESMAYHLWFAREDQVVPNASSLVFPAQEDAGWRVRAIPGGHVDILRHERTSEFLNSVLNEID